MPPLGDDFALLEGIILALALAVSEPIRPTAGDCCYYTVVKIEFLVFLSIELIRLAWKPGLYRGVNWIEFRGDDLCCLDTLLLRWSGRGPMLSCLLPMSILFSNMASSIPSLSVNYYDRENELIWFYYR